MKKVCCLYGCQAALLGWEMAGVIVYECWFFVFLITFSATRSLLLFFLSLPLCSRCFHGCFFFIAPPFSFSSCSFFHPLLFVLHLFCIQISCYLVFLPCGAVAFYSWKGGGDQGV